MADYAENKTVIMEKLGDKPEEKLYFKDYAEYESKKRAGEVLENYDEDATRWGQFQGGLDYDDYGDQDDQTVGQANYFGGPIGHQPGGRRNFSSKIREDYDPYSGCKIVKRVSTVFNTPRNAEYGDYSENYTIRHWGGNSDFGGAGRGDFVPGLFLYYTPVLNNSLIRLECQLVTYVTQNSYQMWTGLWRIGDDDVGGWQHRSYVSGPNSHQPVCDINSWGSGLQKKVAFVLNSYSSSYKAGLYGSTHPGFARRFMVTEIENPNPYGPAVTKWTPETIYF